MVAEGLFFGTAETFEELMARYSRLQAQLTRRV